MGDIDIVRNALSYAGYDENGNEVDQMMRALAALDRIEERLSASHKTFYATLAELKRLQAENEEK